MTSGCRVGTAAKRQLEACATRPNRAARAAAESGRLRWRSVRLSTVRAVARLRRYSTHSSTTDSGALAPAVIRTVSTPSNQRSSMSPAPSIRCAGTPRFAGELLQPLAVGAVLAAQHEHQVGLGREHAHGFLAVLRGVADVFLGRADDAAESAA